MTYSKLDVYCKNLERTEYLPSTHFMARVDGKSFHTYTRHMEKPFDTKLVSAFLGTMNAVANEMNATFVYHQSDEITFFWYFNSENEKTQLPFDGKVNKLNSILASLTTGIFNRYADKFFVAPPLAVFDCRVFSVSIEDAQTVLRWRYLDARRNSLNMIARCFFSHKEPLNLKTKDIYAKLLERGIDPNTYPDAQRNGTLLVRTPVEMENENGKFLRRKLLPKDIHSFVELSVDDFDNELKGNFNGAPLSSFA